MNKLKEIEMQVVRQWIEADFHSFIADDKRMEEAAFLLKIGHEKGDSVAQIIRTVVASVVLDAAGIDPVFPGQEN